MRQEYTRWDVRVYSHEQLTGVRYTQKMEAASSHQR